MKRNKSRILLSLIITAVMLLCCACMQANIKEDEIREDLVALDPQAALEKEITFVCYSQMLDEPYLAGITRTVVLSGGERAENAIIESVINAPMAISGEQGRLFPEGTEVVDLSMDGNVLYLTLSGEFLDESELTRENERLKKELDDGLCTQKEYDNNIKTARDVFFTRRRMAVYALANTISGYSDNTRLLLLVDTEGKGTGVRLPRSVFFYQDDTSALIEPLTFEEDVVVSSEKMATLFLQHWQSREYEAMYELLTFSYSENPVDYNAFEAEMRERGELKNYQVNGISLQGNDMQQINVSLTVVDSSGRDLFLENSRLSMRNDGGLFRPDYTSFRQILEAL